MSDFREIRDFLIIVNHILGNLSKYPLTGPSKGSLEYQYLECDIAELRDILHQIGIHTGFVFPVTVRHAIFLIELILSLLTDGLNDYCNEYRVYNIV